MPSTPSRSAADVRAECAVCRGPLTPRFERVVDPQTREVFSIDACTDCGLGHTQPVPRDVGAYYGPAYHGGRHGVTADWCIRRRLAFVRRAGVSAGALLDVGCGDGSFLAAAAAAGFSVCGTEMTPAAARSRGVRVETSLEAVRAVGPFAAITAWHSLEHFPEPLATLRELVRLLAPGGALIVAVPNADGIPARLFGARWFHLDVPRHLCHFGERSLRRAAELAGGQVVHTWHHEAEYDVFGLMQSWLNGFMPNPNVMFDVLTGKPTTASPLEKGLSVALGAVAGPAAAAGAALTTAAGRGGTLVAVITPA